MLRDAAAKARAQSASANGNGNGTGLATSDDTVDEEVLGAVRTLREAQGEAGAGTPDASSGPRLVAAPTDDVDDVAVPSLHGSADGDDEGMEGLAQRGNAHMKAAGALEVLARQKTAAPGSRAARAQAARARAGARQRPVR